MRHRLARWLQQALLATLLLGSGGLAAETFVVGYYNHGMPPLFFAKHEPETGIYQDILDAVGEITGDRFVKRYATVARIINEFGKVCDIEPGIHPAWRPEQEDISLYSYPFMESGDILAMRADRAFKVEGPEDLQGQRVGLVRGYLYPGWMPNVGGFSADFSPDERVLFQKFRRHRLDYFYATPAMVNWYREKWQLDLVTAKVLYRFPISFRLHISHHEALPRLNKALQQLEADGTLARILAKYQAGPF